MLRGIIWPLLWNFVVKKPRFIKLSRRLCEICLFGRGDNRNNAECHYMTTRNMSARAASCIKQGKREAAATLKALLCGARRRIDRRFFKNVAYKSG